MRAPVSPEWEVARAAKAVALTDLSLDAKRLFEYADRIGARWVAAEGMQEHLDAMVARVRADVEDVSTAHRVMMDETSRHNARIDGDG